MESMKPTLGIHADVRPVELTDAPALHDLDYSFETDRIFTLHIQGYLSGGETAAPGKPALGIELRETIVDLPLYKDYRDYTGTLAEVEVKIAHADGGYVALARGKIAGAVLLHLERWRSLARITDIFVGRQFRRYGIGSLLLNCASDWARASGCWAILLETQNVNYPAIQFYLRNGLEVWSISQHFYPPGPNEHEVAIFMGKLLR